MEVSPGGKVPHHGSVWVGGSTVYRHPAPRCMSERFAAPVPCSSATASRADLLLNDRFGETVTANVPLPANGPIAWTAIHELAPAFTVHRQAASVVTLTEPA